MSTITIPLFGAQLKIKRRRAMRYVEHKRQVPLILVGGLCISYWSKRVVEREAKLNQDS